VAGQTTHDCAEQGRGCILDRAGGHLRVVGEQAVAAPTISLSCKKPNTNSRTPMRLQLVISTAKYKQQKQIRK
jgi:hypothetical protein